MGMHLTSPAFGNGDRIPERFSCDGLDQSPPLAWSEEPKGTHSFALFCDDPDAPGGTFHHWAVYDIPVSTHELSEGFPRTPTAGLVRQGVNDFGKVGYGGACPPRGHGPHHYHFKLMALDVGHLPVRGSHCRDIEAAARTHALAEIDLVGIYSR
ncbi:YbhB/YbcL family Raf kinase inhibitor-like protein [Mycobacterium sp. KBS0706]|uniref:YbhB/YbcL family Raf kinase inhibitor-like protein n=1 Tax=Mycobacterium sp. KBS0706 TaxID=2578109 RepID=UPI001C8F325E|nr:YbhB/YbcL family Raf kinase inhibitor-like protein [Mycobacterium sp. KBS0706]